MCASVCSHLAHFVDLFAVTLQTPGVLMHGLLIFVLVEGVHQLEGHLVPGINLSMLNTAAALDADSVRAIVKLYIYFQDN